MKWENLKQEIISALEKAEAGNSAEIRYESIMRIFGLNDGEKDYASTVTPRDEELAEAFGEEWEKSSNTEEFVKRMVKRRPSDWEVWSMAKKLAHEQDYEKLCSTYCRQSCSDYHTIICKEGFLPFAISSEGGIAFVNFPTGGDETDTRCVVYVIDSDDRLEWSPAYGTFLCLLNGKFQLFRKPDKRSAPEAEFQGKYDLYQVRTNRFALVRR